MTSASKVFSLCVYLGLLAGCSFVIINSPMVVDPQTNEDKTPAYQGYIHAFVLSFSFGIGSYAAFAHFGQRPVRVVLVITLALQVMLVYVSLALDVFFIDRHDEFRVEGGTHTAYVEAVIGTMFFLTQLMCKRDCGLFTDTAADSLYVGYDDYWRAAPTVAPSPRDLRTLLTSPRQPRDAQYGTDTQYV